MRGKLSNEQKQMAFRLRAHGMSLVDIARQTGCTAPMVGLMVRDGLFTSGLPSDWEPRPGALTVTDREAILLGIGRGESLSMIARVLARAPPTITREVSANGGRVGYRAWWAHRRARDCARRPKPFKLAGGPLLDEVSKGLLELWSPLQIAGRLLLDHPQRPDMHVSPETIYQSLFVEGRGALRRELARCLRSGRTARRSRQFRDGRGRIPEMIMVGERPDDVDDRQAAGHWEGDLGARRERPQRSRHARRTIEPVRARAASARRTSSSECRSRPQARHRQPALRDVSIDHLGSGR